MTGFLLACLAGASAAPPPPVVAPAATRHRVPATPPPSAEASPSARPRPLRRWRPLVWSWGVGAAEPPVIVLQAPAPPAEVAAPSLWQLRDHIDQTGLAVAVDELPGLTPISELPIAWTILEHTD